MSHLESRVLERLIGAGFSFKRAEELVASALAAARRFSSAAVLVASLRHHYGDTSGQKWDRASNGDEVWVVVRSGTAMTVMFRRSAQPKRCDRFNTWAVISAQGTIFDRN